MLDSYEKYISYKVAPTSYKWDYNPKSWPYKMGNWGYNPVIPASLKPYP